MQSANIASKIFEKFLFCQIAGVAARCGRLALARKGNWNSVSLSSDICWCVNMLNDPFVMIDMPTDGVSTLGLRIFQFTPRQLLGENMS